MVGDGPRRPRPDWIRCSRVVTGKQKSERDTVFTRITNTPRDYAWGSPTAIAEFLGRTPSGGPEAELWLGAHAGSPSDIADPASTPADLAAWIREAPERALGAELARTHGRLPFLLKLLAADSALSLQAHPTTEQAREGFAREEAAGIPVDAPFRNYRDESAKPEIVVALSETFHALSGFRPWQQTLAILELLHSADATAPGDGSIALLQELLEGADPLRETVSVLLGGSRSGEVAELVERVCVLALTDGVLASEFAPSFETVTELAESYPGDSGIVLSLLLNRVTLSRGEALFLDAGNIHAYLRGFGIELMSASDNVLRGGLTPKHIDVPELLRVLNFHAMEPPLLAVCETSLGVTTYDAGAEDFVLHRIQAPAGLSVTGPAIALAQSGSTTIRGKLSEMVLTQGESTYLTPNEERLQIMGEGVIWLAMAPAVQPTHAHTSSAGPGLHTL